jgi:hypothetical protein
LPCRYGQVGTWRHVTQLKSWPIGPQEMERPGSGLRRVVGFESGAPAPEGWSTAEAGATIPDHWNPEHPWTDNHARPAINAASSQSFQLNDLRPQISHVGSDFPQRCPQMVNFHMEVVTTTVIETVHDLLHVMKR